jgi:hypothetical protein
LAWKEERKITTFFFLSPQLAFSIRISSSGLEMTEEVWARGWMPGIIGDSKPGILQRILQTFHRKLYRNEVLVKPKPAP